MKLAVMQPYFLPYIGYYQLIAAVDTFVIYDNIKYTKKGWINRNRMLVDGAVKTFTLPLKGAADSLQIVQREISPDFQPQKLINQFKAAYRRAPSFSHTMPLLERAIGNRLTNLFDFLRDSILATTGHLGLDTRIITSSTVDIDHDLKGQNKVIALCRALGADTYINTIGGVELYSREDFRTCGVDLKFIRSEPFEYPQGGNAFVPCLSIVDILMHNPLDVVKQHVLNSYGIS
jgi:hypothetical protein